MIILKRYRFKIRLFEIPKSGVIKLALNSCACVTDLIETSWSKEVEHRTKFAMNFGKKKGILRQGDLVIHISSSKPNTFFPNSMKLFFVNAGDFIEDVF